MAMTVLFGEEYKGTILAVDTYFNHVYQKEWFNPQDEFITSIIKDIDKCDLVGMNVLSPIFGSISIRDISGGAKSLIMLYKMDDFITDLIVFGNNCEDKLVELMHKKDTKVCMNGYDMTFEGHYDLDIICENDGSHITNWLDWVDKMVVMV